MAMSVFFITLIANTFNLYNDVFINYVIIKHIVINDVFGTHG